MTGHLVRLVRRVIPARVLALLEELYQPAADDELQRPVADRPADRPTSGEDPK